MPADTYVISVSYTNLVPYRRHVLLLDTMRRQVRLISDPRDFPVADSGWHGTHTWAPGTAAFVLDDFHYDGHRANFSHRMVFTLDGFSHKKKQNKNKKQKKTPSWILCCMGPLALHWAVRGWANRASGRGGVPGWCWNDPHDGGNLRVGLGLL